MPLGEARTWKARAPEAETVAIPIAEVFHVCGWRRPRAIPGDVDAVDCQLARFFPP
jgi:hypothetical protein